MALPADKPPFLGRWLNIYLVVLVNLAAWIAILATFTFWFEPTS